MLGKTPGASGVEDKMKKLETDGKSVDDLQAKRMKDLQNAYDLQVKHICFTFNLQC